ncbi:type IV secretion system protein [Candidatus Sarmatiella mevalonica]|uniref:type IV secretion system protein n=1 Tax=Candidatus Sarmatiella mevalonica TaxID=2770581 RepID=UPI00192331CF|nr:type IV secretion system protein [Candidatus Sarmatiella mevalonica]
MLTTVISGCDSTYNCLEADDFGHAKIQISSRYDFSEEDESSQSKEDSDSPFTPPKYQLIQKEKNLQIAPWIDSGLVADGGHLMIMVKGWDKSEPNEPGVVSAWCPWFGYKGEGAVLSDFAMRFPTCVMNGPMCSQNKNLQLKNAPCILTKGIGLYMLIPKDDINPNANLLSGNTQDYIRHVGEETNGYKVYDISYTGKLRETRALRYDPAPFSQPRKIYFKILDKHYLDNSGGYVLHVKSGIEASSLDPFEMITKVVQKLLFDEKSGIVTQLYNSIINSTSYKLAVSTLLVLYIAIFGIRVMFGNVEFNKSEIISRMIKICIISMLINTELSWRFFHDYLFTFFIEFLNKVLILIKSAQKSSGGKDAMTMLLSKETLIKLSSIIFTGFLGFIYVFLFLSAILLMIVLMVQTFVYYGFSLVMIGMAISLAPIFLCTILFDVTRDLFQNWLRQLMSYSLQLIVLFVGISITTNVLRNEVYGSLGFGVCKVPMLRVFAFILGNENRETLSKLDKWFYIWLPQPRSGFSGVYEQIPIPNGHQEDQRYCKPYECVGYRYVEFPFLDPTNDIDQQRLIEFFNGNFIHYSSLATLCAALALAYYTNVSSIQLGQMLASNAGSSSGKIAENSSGFISSVHGAYMQPVNSYEKVKKLYIDPEEDWKHPVFSKRLQAIGSVFLDALKSSKDSSNPPSHIFSGLSSLSNAVQAISENTQGNIKTQQQVDNEAEKKAREKEAKRRAELQRQEAEKESGKKNAVSNKADASKGAQKSASQNKPKEGQLTEKRSAAQQGPRGTNVKGDTVLRDGGVDNLQAPQLEELRDEGGLPEHLLDEQAPREPEGSEQLLGQQPVQEHAQREEIQVEAEQPLGQQPVQEHTQQEEIQVEAEQPLERQEGGEKNDLRQKQQPKQESEFERRLAQKTEEITKNNNNSLIGDELQDQIEIEQDRSGRNQVSQDSTQRSKNIQSYDNAPLDQDDGSG